MGSFSGRDVRTGFANRPRVGRWVKFDALRKDRIAQVDHATPEDPSPGISRDKATGDVQSETYHMVAGLQNVASILPASN